MNLKMQDPAQSLGLGQSAGFGSILPSSPRHRLWKSSQFAYKQGQRNLSNHDETVSRTLSVGSESLSLDEVRSRRDRTEPSPPDGSRLCAGDSMI